VAQEIIQGYRLSPQQKRLWLMHQAGQPLHSEACLIEMTGVLDEAALLRAIQSVVERHEILRTSFQLLSGMTIPVQVIEEHAAVSLETEDWSSLDADEQTKRIGKLCDEAEESDLAQLPLFRARLMRISATRNLLLLSAPPLCLDQPSLRFLFTEIAGGYEHTNGRPAEGEAMQYADFAEWQNELLESAEASSAQQYWQKVDLSRAEKLPFEDLADGEETAVNISAAALQKLLAISDKLGLDVATLLLACWHLILHKSTGWDHTVVATAFDGRNFPELQNAIGPIERYLPISLSHEENPTLSSAAQALNETLRDSAKLQQYFPPDHSPNLADVVSQIGFAWVESPADITAGDLNVRFVRFVRFVSHSNRDDGRFKLKLVGERSVEGLISARLHFDGKRFSAEVIERLRERFETLIEAIGNGDERPVSELEVIGSQERELLLVEFNGTAQQFPAGRCIHELFAEQALKTPDASAVVFEEEKLTFAELNARANKFAHALRRAGVRPDDAVGLCLERSVDLIAGLLGIMKAGGAYLPLDPGLPVERIKGMLADAGAKVLLTRKGLDHDFAKSIFVDDVRDNANGTLNAELETKDFKTDVTDQNLAYIIFTSGSTGRPKGVAVEHRQLANYVGAIQERLHIPEGSSFASVSTIAADLGNTVLFPSLLTGGTLHLVSEERATNPDALAEYFLRHRIDCLKIVPSHLAALLSAAHPAAVLPARTLVLGGEACPQSLLERVKELAPDCQVINHYGPTETTVGATTFATGETGTQTNTVPLGRPLANVQAYVCDQSMRLTPLGVPGELYLGGAGVARGYVGKPDATAEKFVPHPFAKMGGERLYRTGDRARFLADGRLEFLGRVDDQVKIHGYRIEPSEIATVLREHDSIKEAIVTAREDQPGEKRLVGYIVCEDKAVDAASLRSFLQDKLPEYMIPRSLVFLEFLPLTRNGKIDRKALPAPEVLRGDTSGFVKPRNQVEETLAGIWSTILGIEQLSIHDNFFELGGDSILSIQIIARANQSGLKLSPRQVFQHQTIAELAAVAGTEDAVIVEQGLVTGPVPLTPVQTRFFAQELPEPHHYNQAMLLNLEEPIDVALLEQAFAQLLIHHDALRSRFQRIDGRWQQEIIAATEPVQVSEFELTELPDHAEVMQSSLNLKDGPLLRAGLFKSSDGKPGKLLIVIHHLVVDGVSWRIILEDLQRSYSALTHPQSPALPEKTTSFKRWSELLSAQATSDELAEELPYWLDRFETSSLPVDFDSHDNIAASADTITVALNPRETLALLMEAPAAYRTQINEVLIAALAQTLSNWTASSHVLLDLEGHGREDIFPSIDITRSVGWFTTIFPVALDLQESDSVISSLRHVKEQLRAIPNRGIGYGLLRYLGNDAARDALNDQTQAQVRFNYLGQTDRALSDGGLFKPAGESTGPSQAASAPRGYLLNVIGAVSGGQLRFEWTYSRNIHRRETIAQLGENYLARLRALIAQARSADAATLSPTDFSSSKLSREDLNKVLAKLRG